MPKISVIMPAYNAEKYIAEAIDSILGQTYSDFEFIIINDCSRDRTEEIILSYKDPRIVYLKNEENLGVAATLNKGLSVAKGEYIARMDADDISMPERFEKQLAYLEVNEEIAVLGCGIERFSDNASLDTRRFASDADLMAIDMLFACGLAHPSVMMRTEVIRELGGYDPEFNGLEDYELWCRVLEGHIITALTDVLLRYRIHSSQVTQNPSEHYLEKLRKLQTKQLRRLKLGSQQSGVFLRYCLSKKLDTSEDIKELDDFFKLADAQNEEMRIYNAEKLRAAFRSIMRSCALRVSWFERYQLIATCKYLKMREWMYFSLKQKAKKLIKYIMR